MAGGSISGMVGRIEWSYYVAAAINGYIVTRSQAGRWSLVATVVTADAFKLRQRPLQFVALHEQGAWRWPIELIESIEHETETGPHQLRAILGTPL